MFLKMLSDESQKVFLQTCVLAAKANGVVAKEEQAMMSEYCHEMGRMEQISWVDVPKESVFQNVSKISSDKEKKIILLEILGLVKADNVYDAQEQEFVAELVEAMGLSTNTSGYITELLDKYLSACKELADAVLS